MMADFDKLCHMAKIEMQCYQIEHDVHLSAEEQLKFLYETLNYYMRNYAD